MKIYPLQIFKIYNNYNPQIQANKPEFVITDLQHDIVSFGKKRNHKKEKTNLTEEEQLALIQQRKRAQFEFKNRVKEEKIKRIEAKKEAKPTFHHLHNQNKKRHHHKIKPLKSIQVECLKLLITKQAPLKTMEE